MNKEAFIAGFLEKQSATYQGIPIFKVKDLKDLTEEKLNQMVHARLMRAFPNSPGITDPHLVLPNEAQPNAALTYRPHEKTIAMLNGQRRSPFFKNFVRAAVPDIDRKTINDATAILLNNSDRPFLRDVRARTAPGGNPRLRNTLAHEAWHANTLSKNYPIIGEVNLGQSETLARLKGLAATWAKKPNNNFTPAMRRQAIFDSLKDLGGYTVGSLNPAGLTYGGPIGKLQRLNAMFPSVIPRTVNTLTSPIGQVASNIGNKGVQLAQHMMPSVAPAIGAAAAKLGPIARTALKTTMGPVGTAYGLGMEAGNIQQYDPDLVKAFPKAMDANYQVNAGPSRWTALKENLNNPVTATIGAAKNVYDINKSILTGIVNPVIEQDLTKRLSDNRIRNQFNGQQEIPGFGAKKFNVSNFIPGFGGTKPVNPMGNNQASPSMPKPVSPPVATPAPKLNFNRIPVTT